MKKLPENRISSSWCRLNQVTFNNHRHCILYGPDPCPVYILYIRWLHTWFILKSLTDPFFLTKYTLIKQECQWNNLLATREEGLLSDVPSINIDFTAYYSTTNEVYVLIVISVFNMCVVFCFVTFIEMSFLVAINSPFPNALFSLMICLIYMVCFLPDTRDATSDGSQQVRKHSGTSSHCHVIRLH